MEEEEEVVVVAVLGLLRIRIIHLRLLMPGFRKMLRSERCAFSLVLFLLIFLVRMELISLLLLDFYCLMLCMNLNLLLGGEGIFCHSLMFEVDYSS